MRDKNVNLIVVKDGDGIQLGTRGERAREVMRRAEMKKVRGLERERGREKDIEAYQLRRGIRGENRNAYRMRIFMEGCRGGRT